MPTQLASNLFVLGGAVNTGVLVAGRQALLFDCCDTVSPARLAELGVDTVAAILCTQHRRPNVAGAYPFLAGGARLIAPAGERHLCEDPAAYWNDWRNRWHIYHHQPGLQVPARPLPVARAVGEGDVVEWEGFAIHVLDTPGATTGSVSYLVEAGGQRIVFSGDVVYGPGQVWDLYSLQKGFGCIGDYHGFLGQRRALSASLQKLASCGADLLVPSHGAPVHGVAAATELAAQRLEAVWRNYTAISALNHYFPDLLAETRSDPRRMAPARTVEPPPFVRRVAYTSLAVISETGAALLVDCGHDAVIDTLQQWRQEGLITGVEACWVTHYHDDHVDALHRLAQAFGCPILADQHMAEIVEHPLRFFLPCIAPAGAPVARATREGESWPWHEFQLTFCHFPGQTYYHGGLLVDGHGCKVFFCGDSGAPTGLDDYCCGNRTFLGAGLGFRRCIDIWRQCRPDYILNEHQDLAFAFTPEELDAMEAMLAERERLLAALLPWPDPNFGLDEGWVRTYPYEQEAWPGGAAAVEVQFTNHGPRPAEAAVEPVLPAGWLWDRERSVARVQVPARTGGSTASCCPRPDGAARVWVLLPKDARAGRYVLPFRVTWGGRYLGQVRHAIVAVRNS